MARDDDHEKNFARLSQGERESLIEEDFRRLARRDREGLINLVVDMAEGKRRIMEAEQALEAEKRWRRLAARPVTLRQLREARGLLQSGIGGMEQGVVSLVERAPGTSLAGTVRRYVEGLGARLVLSAVFNRRVVELRQFSTPPAPARADIPAARRPERNEESGFSRLDIEGLTKGLPPAARREIACAMRHIVQDKARHADLWREMEALRPHDAPEGGKRQVSSALLRQLRHEEELTMEALAARMGVMKGQVARLEGREANPYIDSIAAYVNGLGGRLEAHAEFPARAPVALDMAQFARAKAAPMRKAGGA